MNERNNSLATRIKKARLATGLSQSELARILRVKPQAIQHWERGKANPKTSRMGELAEALNVQAAWLFLEENENKKYTRKEPSDLTIDEQMLIKTYRLMDSNRQMIFNEIAIAFVHRS